MVHPRLPSGKPDFSQVVPCRCLKKGLDEERLARLRRYSNLGTLARFTFENLEPQGRSGNPKNQERYKRVYEAAQAFASDPKGWLVLIGPSGSGKTHLAAAIANRAIERGQPVLFVVVPDLLDHLRATFTPQSTVTFDQRFEEVRRAPLLILDDLGTESATPWAREKLYQIFDYRYNARLPTVITTSRWIEEVDPRLATRMLDVSRCTPVPITAPDYQSGTSRRRGTGRRRKG